MYKSSVLFATCLAITVNLIISLESYAACSTKVLKQVCDVCEQRALNKLGTDSVFPPKIQTSNSGPESLSCIKLDSYVPLLQNYYSISAMIYDGEPDTVFRIAFKKSATDTNSFKYDVRDGGFRTLVNDSFGYIYYDIINFNLPLVSGDKTLSYNCLGSIDNKSILKGVCLTIAPDENGNNKPFGWEFTALPNSSPIQ